VDTHASWDALARQARQHGPVPAHRLPDADADSVLTCPTLVGLPDGRASHLLHVLDGQWFTQRVRASTLGRDDLWVTSAVAPLVTVLFEGPLPLRSGGELSTAAHFQQAVVGPRGWLPAVPAGGLVALRISGGVVETTAVPALSSSPEQDQFARELLGRHYRNAAWNVDDEPTTRLTLTRAVAASVLEVPHLFVEPRTPLDELLYDPLHETYRHDWRDVAAWQGEGNVSFTVQGMPAALHAELDRRARLYGMAFDQFTIAVLGHLAWRTPFAEDLEPWEGWVAADDAPEPAPLRPLP
jgi:hypothetical protein